LRVFLYRTRNANPLARTGQNAVQTFVSDFLTAEWQPTAKHGSLRCTKDMRPPAADFAFGALTTFSVCAPVNSEFARFSPMIGVNRRRTLQRASES
jgi:hypothetical protein